MNHCLGPDEGDSAGVVALDEGIDVIPELLNAGEAGTRQRACLEDGEPDLDLVEPGTVSRREVKADIRMTGQPAVALWLVGRQVVDDDVDLLARDSRR